MGHGSNLAASLLLFGVILGASPANAEVPVEGAYENLSPGNQKVARALFEAQASTTAPAPGPTTAAPGGTATAPKTLTLDEIAAMKENGKGWGQVFKEMRAHGLVQEKNLGQVVSAYNHRSHAATPAGSVGVAATRTKSGSQHKSGDDGGTKYSARASKAGVHSSRPEDGEGYYPAAGNRYGADGRPSASLAGSHGSTRLESGGSDPKGGAGLAKTVGQGGRK